MSTNYGTPYHAGFPVACCFLPVISKFLPSNLFSDTHVYNSYPPDSQRSSFKRTKQKRN